MILPTSSSTWLGTLLTLAHRKVVNALLRYRSRNGASIIQGQGRARH